MTHGRCRRRFCCRRFCRCRFCRCCFAAVAFAAVAFAAVAFLTTIVANSDAPSARIIFDMPLYLVRKP